MKTNCLFHRICSVLLALCLLSGNFLLPSLAEEVYLTDEPSKDIIDEILEEEPTEEEPETIVEDTLPGYNEDEESGIAPQNEDGGEGENSGIDLAAIPAAGQQVALTDFYNAIESSNIAIESEDKHNRFGSGSYMFNEDGSKYRFYAEYYTAHDTSRSITLADIPRKNIVKVYLYEGDYLCLGSSVYDSQLDLDNKKTGGATGKDIVLILPDGSTRVDFDVTNQGAGHISTRNQEVFGPALSADAQNATVNANDTTDDKSGITQGQSCYYTPLVYQAGTDGIYTIEFRSVDGYNNGQNTPTAQKASASFIGKQGKVGVAAWDVTVVGRERVPDDDGTNTIKKTDGVKDDPYTVRSGRAWANHVALTTSAGSQAKSNLDVYVLAHDGYEYKVHMDNVAPFGFVFFANNMGFTTVEKDTGEETVKSIYHSFYDDDNELANIKSEEGVTVHNPAEPDTATQFTHKIFFNRPSEDLPRFIKPNPQPLAPVSDLSFAGVGENIATYGQGGTFRFKTTSAANITLRLDFREALANAKAADTAQQNQHLQSYTGTGLVELNVACEANKVNYVHWDGKDNVGQYIPEGEYDNNSVTLEAEAKMGEIHFPMVDVEEIGGLTVERLTNAEQEDNSRFDLYYNNYPLSVGSIEGTTPNSADIITKKNEKGVNTKYYKLPDGVYSAFISDSLSGKAGTAYFKRELYDKLLHRKVTDYTPSYPTIPTGDAFVYTDYISTLKPYTDSTSSTGSTGMQQAYHHVPVNSSEKGMVLLPPVKVSGSGYALNPTYYGGGNQAGIDTWTYYKTEGSTLRLQRSIAIMPEANTGKITGEVFFDADGDAAWDDKGTNTKERPIEGMKFRLIGKYATTDSNGNTVYEYRPVVHTLKQPVFDEEGFFVRDENGVVYETKEVDFESYTDANGKYEFTTVPYTATDGDEYAVSEAVEYYVQAMLTTNETDLLKYICTTGTAHYATLSKHPSTYDQKVENLQPLVTAKPVSENVGGDGTTVTITQPTETNRYYVAAYTRWAQSALQTENVGIYMEGDTKFDVTNAQAVTLTKGTTDATATASFKDIGYSTCIPVDNQMSLTVKKEWDDTSVLSSLTVKLYVWEPTGPGASSHETGFTRRSGTLLGTVKLTPEGWSYTWDHLDNTRQYFVEEFYTKLHEDGTPVQNDRGEDRLVHIGSTMPVLCTIASKTVNNTQYSNYYQYFAAHGVTGTNLHNDLKERRLQCFEEYKNGTHSTSYGDVTTIEERSQNVDNDAFQYTMTYTLKQKETVTDGNKRVENILTLYNKQVYDEKEYYVWYGHETFLDDFISRTYYDDGQERTHPVTMEICNHGTSASDDFTTLDHPKGITITSLDAAGAEAAGGHDGQEFSSYKFHLKNDNDTGLYFTADNTIYHTGTGTRTYKVQYTVKYPVSQPDSGQTTGDETAIKVKRKTASDTDTAYSHVAVGDPIPAEAIGDGYDWKTYTWHMTIHVYDLNDDEPILYDPSIDREVTLQGALEPQTILDWKQKPIPGAAGDRFALMYVIDNDPWKAYDIPNRLLGNDVIRVPLFKEAAHHLMSDCADLVGFAYSPDGVLNDAAAVQALEWHDNAKPYSETVKVNPETPNVMPASNELPITLVGKGGTLKSFMTIPRNHPMTYGQDHAYHVNVGYQAKQENFGNQPDTFYYKVFIHAHDIDGSYARNTTSTGEQEEQRSGTQGKTYEQIPASQGVVMYACFTMKPITSDVKIAAASLSIGDNLDINYYVSGIDEAKAQDASLGDIDHYSMDFNVGGMTTDKQKHKEGKSLKTTAEDKNLYGYTFAELPAYLMGEKVLANLYFQSETTYDEGDVMETHPVTLDTKKYSVPTYVKNMMEKSKQGENTNLLSMLIDLLNYGTTAQNYALQENWVKLTSANSTDTDSQPEPTPVPSEQAEEGSEDTEESGTTYENPDAGKFDGEKVAFSKLTVPNAALADHADWFTKAGKSYTNETFRNAYTQQLPTPNELTDASVESGKGVTILGVNLVMNPGMNMDLKVSFKAEKSALDSVLILPGEDTNLTVEGATATGANGSVFIGADHFQKLELSDAALAELDMISDDDCYYITIQNVPPFMWNNVYKLKFKKGDTVVCTLEYSVFNYIHNMMNSGSTQLNQLLRSMYWYGKSANTWMTSTESSTSVYGNAVGSSVAESPDPEPTESPAA